MNIINYYSCDLLENTYLCGSNNNMVMYFILKLSVVICLKIRTFVVATTTHSYLYIYTIQL